MPTLVTNNNSDNSDNSKSATEITNAVPNTATTVNTETDTVSFVPDFVVVNESDGSNFS